MKGLNPAAAIALVMTLLAVGLTRPVAMAREEEDWLEWDTPPPTPYDATLVLIDAPAPDDLYRIRNRARLTPEAIETGWIQLHQCHENLDAVPDLQIVYRPGRIEWIRIDSHENIGAARVEGLSVQLQDIRRGASLCLTLRKRMARRDGADGYLLSHGPFYRQFLDGYYPMQVLYHLDYPAEQARVSLINRDEIEGVMIDESEGEIAVDAHFAGRLRLEIAIESVDDE